METKAVRVSLINHKILADIGHKTDSFNDTITKVLDDYEEYQKIKDLVEDDKEFDNGEGVHFSSLEELDDIWMINMELEFKRSCFKTIKIL